MKNFISHKTCFNLKRYKLAPLRSFISDEFNDMHKMYYYKFIDDDGSTSKAIGGIDDYYTNYNDTPIVFAFKARK